MHEKGHAHETSAFAYDYGGCDCEKCRPWILTFARLMKEIHALALRRHPAIEPWFCSWWWTPEEHAQFNDWAAREASGWLKAMTMHIEYNQARPKDVAVPAGCRKLAFVHAGYDDRRGNELYGRQGAVIAPRRLPETLRQLRQLGFEGFQAYSEGVFDDVNKMLLAGLGSAQYSASEAALDAYARRYFNAPPDGAAAWAKWIAQWGGEQTIPPHPAPQEFARCVPDAPRTWRLEHWSIRIQLENLNRALGAPKPAGWTPEKLALANQWFAAQERLYREVYRLGPVRHVLNPRFMPPPWHASWLQATAASTPEAPRPLPQQ